MPTPHFPAQDAILDFPGGGGDKFCLLSLPTTHSDIYRSLDDASGMMICESGAAVAAAAGIWFIHACCDIPDRMNEIRRGLGARYGTSNGGPDACTQVRLMNQALLVEKKSCHGEMSNNRPLFTVRNNLV